MLVLAIDTSTPAVTTGIAKLAGDRIESITTRVTVNARAHGELLTPHISEAAQEAGVALRELDAIVCGVGPGPFTGLRAGMATAAALGHALDIPVYPVCGLDAIAVAAYSVVADAAKENDDATFLVATDARRREVYWALYDLRGKRLDGPAVGRPEEIVTTARFGVGAGANQYADVLDLLVVPDFAFPEPTGLVAAAKSQLLTNVRPAPLTPLYLRRPDVAEPSVRKKVTGA